MPEGRNAGSGQFLPGISGNPHGRPKLPEGLKAAARSYARSAMAVLDEIMSDAKVPPSIRVSAALGLLARTGGLMDDGREIDGEIADDIDLLRAVIEHRAVVLGLSFEETLRVDPDLAADWSAAGGGDVEG